MAGSDLFTGTLDILILKALTWGPRHGYAIGRWIRETTEDVLAVQEGALYPALHRLERRGVISEEWGQTDTGRQAKYYTLTAAGRALDGVLTRGHARTRRRLGIMKRTFRLSDTRPDPRRDVSDEIRFHLDMR